MNFIEIGAFYWKVLWPLVIALIVVAIFKILFELIIPDLLKGNAIRRKFNSGQRWRNDNEIIDWLNKLSPTEFEEQTAEMFRRMGYSVRITGRSHDNGVDVELRKDGVKSIVQCKHYTNKVGRPDVAQFYGDLAHHLATNGFFVTTNFFTLEAVNYAADKPIELIDATKLIHYMKEARLGFSSTSLEKNCPK